LRRTDGFLNALANPVVVPLSANIP